MRVHPWLLVRETELTSHDASVEANQERRTVIQGHSGVDYIVGLDPTPQSQASSIPQAVVIDGCSFWEAFAKT